MLNPLFFASSYINKLKSFLSCTMEMIRTYFEKNALLTENDWQIFSSKLIKEDFPKRHLLLKDGQVEQYLSFVEKGIVRFFIPKEENELTFTFVFENTFMSGYDSFITQRASNYNIETLTPTTLWRISYADLQTIYQ